MEAARGTPGYSAPEYVETSVATEASDVYSMGMVLLELLTAVHPARPTLDGGFEFMLAGVRPQDAGAAGRVLDLLDGRAAWPAETAAGAAEFALRCVHMDATRRPRFLEMVSTLEKLALMAAAEARATCESDIPDVALLSMQESLGQQHRPAAADLVLSYATGTTPQEATPARQGSRPDLLEPAAQAAMPTAAPVVDTFRFEMQASEEEAPAPAAPAPAPAREPVSTAPAPAVAEEEEEAPQAREGDPAPGRGADVRGWLAALKFPAGAVVSGAPGAAESPEAQEAADPLADAKAWLKTLQRQAKSWQAKSGPPAEAAPVAPRELVPGDDVSTASSDEQEFKTTMVKRPGGGSGGRKELSKTFASSPSVRYSLFGTCGATRGCSPRYFVLGCRFTTKRAATTNDHKTGYSNISSTVAVSRRRP